MFFNFWGLLIVGANWWPTGSKSVKCLIYLLFLDCGQGLTAQLSGNILQVSRFMGITHARISNGDDQDTAEGEKIDRRQNGTAIFHWTSFLDIGGQWHNLT